MQNIEYLSSKIENIDDNYSSNSACLSLYFKFKLFGEIIKDCTFKRLMIVFIAFFCKDI